MFSILTVSLLVSLPLFLISLKWKEILFVNLCTQFFLYYFFMWVLFDNFYAGETTFFWLSFLIVLFSFWILRLRKNPFYLNSIDLFYLSYFILFMAVYFLFFKSELLNYKPYKTLPFFAVVSLLVPVFFKSFFDKYFVINFLNLLEKFGYLIGVIICLLYVCGVLSKETGLAYSVEMGEALRYAPIKGFFSIRQATVLSMPIIISLSKFVFDKGYFKLPRLFLFLCSLIGIILSGTRGVVLCLLLFFLYIFINLKLLTKVKAIIALPLLVLSIFLFKGTIFFNRIFSVNSYLSEITGFSVRFAYYKQGKMNFLNNPILGNGASSMSQDCGYSHNALISILEYTGIVGFLICFLFIWNYRKVFIVRIKDGDVYRFCLRNLLCFLFAVSFFYGVFVTDYVMLFMLYLYVFVYRDRTARVKLVK